MRRRPLPDAWRGRPVRGVAVALLFVCLPAWCGESRPPDAFAGAWRVVGGAAEAGAPAGATADPDLVGATVAFADGRVDAPHPLGCGGAAYEQDALSAQGLFQGVLDDAGPDAAAHTLARARALGFSDAAAPTLRVNCDTGSFDYHRLPAPTPPRLVLMLDWVIYTLERVPQAP